MHLVQVQDVLLRVASSNADTLLLKRFAKQSISTTYVRPKYLGKLHHLRQLPHEIWTRIGRLLLFDALLRRDFTTACDMATNFQRDILYWFYRRFVDPMMWKDAVRKAALCDELLKTLTSRTLEFLESIHDEALCVERHREPATDTTPDAPQEVVFFEITQPSSVSVTEYPFPWSLDEAERNCVEMTFEKVWVRRRQGEKVDARKRERLTFHEQGDRVCDQMAYVAQPCGCNPSYICTEVLFYPMIIIRVVDELGGSIDLDVGACRDVGLRAAWEGFAELAKLSIPGCTLLWVEDMWFQVGADAPEGCDYLNLTLIA
jgi:hypothetical protein